MDDLISRKAAIDALRRNEALVRAFGYHIAIDAIEELPSAERRGRWETEIITDALGCKHAYYACSLCGKASDDEYTYCPNCGARMEAKE